MKKKKLPKPIFPGIPHPNEEITRLIYNARSDHNICVMSRDRHGMDDFATLARLFKDVSDEDLTYYLGEIDRVRATHNYCVICSLKFLAFCRYFSMDRLPKRYQADGMEYEMRVRTIDNDKIRKRDILSEVRQAIGAARTEPAVFPTNIRAFRGDAEPGPEISDEFVQYLSENIAACRRMKNGDTAALLRKRIYGRY